MLYVLKTVFFASLITVLATGCLEKKMYYPAQVKEKDGLPCFSVEDAKETRKNTPVISTITVFEYGNKAEESIWLRMFPATETRVTLSPDQCIPYGDDGKAPSLEAGKHYYVFLNADIPKGKDWESRRYGGYFCISNDQSGKAIIHPVVWNDSKDGYDWSVCQ